MHCAGWRGHWQEQRRGAGFKTTPKQLPCSASHSHEMGGISNVRALGKNTMADRDSELSQHYLTPAEVAAYLKISIPTVYRQLRQRKLVGTKIGGQWRVCIKALQQYLQESIRIP